MGELPILFSGPMVRAILDGRKTMTRRVVKFCKPFVDHNSWKNVYPNPNGGYVFTDGPLNNPSRDIPVITAGRVGKLCPYGQPGDRLWVRHAWFDLNPPPTNPENYQIWDEFTKAVRWKTGERVSGVTPRMDEGDGWKKHPSICMPRWASLIRLEVTGVHLERLQEISETDCWAEGIERSKESSSRASTIYSDYAHPRRAFQLLWDSLNAKRGFGWDVNPWVWAISFKRISSSG